MTDIQNKIALITGAASGIGRLISTQLAEDGATVVLLDIDQQGAEALRDELRSAGFNAHAWRCDLSSREQIAAAAREVKEQVGDVDILVNNAGIVSGATLLELSDEQIELTYAVNTLALYWTTRAFLGAMLEKNSGNIVTIASAGGIAGTAKLTDYCGSKFAAVGFDDSLRAELKYLGSDVVTTVICPFYINTGMFDGVSTRFPWLLPILKPEDVARRVMGAIRHNRGRVIMPWFVYTTWLVRILPQKMGDWLMRFFGVTESMDKFKGRG